MGVRVQPFNMHHDVSEGLFSGYRVTFAVTFYAHRKPLVQVFATGQGKPTLTDPSKICDILPIDDWPEFAQDAFRQRVEKGTAPNGAIQERLFT